MKRSCDTALVSSSAKEAKTANGGALVPAAPAGGALVAAGPARTSELLAPIMLLTGHGGPVLSTKFSPDGNHVLSGGHDKLMLLWETFGECANILNFKGHANAILEVSWSGDGESAFSASADKTAALWDAKTGGRVRQFKGHTQVVNSFNPSRDANTCASASDDGTCRVWDARVRLCQHTISHPWAVTAACVSHDGMHVYTGCLDGVVRSYDLRNPQITHLELEGHQDIVTGIKLAPDGNSLLSNAMDNVIRCWDVKPYASDDRCTKGTTRTRKHMHARTHTERRMLLTHARSLLSSPLHSLPRRAAQLREESHQMLVVAERHTGRRRLCRQLCLCMGREYEAHRLQAARACRIGE